MSIKLHQNAANADEISLNRHQHILFVLPETEEENIPYEHILKTKLKRIKSEYKELGSNPVTIDLPAGGLASFVVLGDELNTFQRHTLLRKAAKPLLDEKPDNIALCVFGNTATREAHACAAYYVVTVNTAALPSRKKDAKSVQLKNVYIYGYQAEHDYSYVNARVAGNVLCRQLTMTPPNELTPAIYRKKLADLANENGWRHEEFDMPTLKKMRAGAFYAVGQGSEPHDAAIVHLSYQPDNARKHIAIIGKGICFDTGGHNLKPAKYMLGMHEDMNGSAVATGILLAASKMQLPIKIDC